MSTETLSVVNNAVDVRGVAFERNGLVVDPSAKLEDLNRVLAAVSEMDGGTNWWFGDLGLEIQARAATDERLNGDKDAKQGEDREDAEIRRMNMSVAYALAKVEQLGISVDHFRGCVVMARFYKRGLRNPSLSWNHHQVAMHAAGGAKGDPKIAQKWLIRTAEAGWSVSEMRKEANLALASARPSDAPPESNTFRPVDEVDAWLAKRPALPKLTADQAKAQLTRWEALVTFVHSLEEIAAGSQS